jgi:hypothetical protein
MERRMSFQLALIARDPAVENRWSTELKAAALKLPGTPIELVSRLETGPKGRAQVILVDQGLPGLDAILQGISRKGRALFLVVDERQGTPQALSSGAVDDVLVPPFRPLELQSRILHYQQILMWDEVSRLNASFTELLERLREDLKLAERLQKGRLPQRFPEVRGFRVTNRYLAGLKAGGDYFDLAESADGGALSILLSDSSSYGLSTALLSILMRVAIKLSPGETRSARETVHRILEELKLVLGPKDRLSLFFGTVSRKDYRLRFVNLGSSKAFYARPGSGFEPLSLHGQAISASTTAESEAAAAALREEEVLELHPSGRLALLSDGFAEVVGTDQELKALLDGYRDREPADLLNELVFRVKSRFKTQEDMPEQDCSALLFDLDSRLLRLA